MKKTLTTTLFIFSLFSLFSQNWQLVNSNSIQWFKRSDGYLKVVFVDSVRVINNDSVFYFPVTLGGKYLQNKTNYPLVDLKAPWWTGKKMILKPDGRQLFINAEDDTISFLPNQNLLDSWTIVKFVSGNYVKAEIINQISENVLGSIDSVKTIRLNVYSKKDSLLNTPLTNRLIKISKNNGFINIFPLFSMLDSIGTWKYEFSSDKYQVFDYNLTQPRKRLTVNDVFRYNKGDVFEIRNSNTGDVRKSEIKERFVSGDSIHYQTEQVYANNLKWYYLIAIKQEDRWIYQINNLITPSYPEQFEYEDTIDFIPSLQYFYYEGPCGLTKITGKNPNFRFWHDSLFYNTGEAVFNTISYCEHLGVIDSSQSWPNGDPSDSYHYSLTYSQNNYCNIGSSAIGIKYNQNAEIIKLTPNPVIDLLELDNKNTISNIKVFDVFGQELLVASTLSSSGKINISTIHYKPGIYFIQINEANPIKFIKIQ